MTVTTVFATTADGYVESASTVYATARSGGTMSVQAGLTQALQGQQFSSPNYKCWQFFISFDVSAIPATDTIDSVVLSIANEGDNSTTDFTVLALAKTWLPTLATADFVAGASLSGLTELATLNTSGGVALGYVAFTETGTNLRAAVDAAAGVGSVEIVIASSRQRDNNTPTGNEYILWSTANTTGTAADPKLVITHSAPVATNAPAGHASGTGAASSATVSSGPTAGVATGTGAASNPKATVSASAGVAQGAGSAYGASIAPRFDAATQSIRTVTTDPYSFNHTGRATASGGVQGVVVSIINYTTATDQVTGVTYGGVPLTRVIARTDTASEPTNSQLWFAGSGLTGGTQSVQVDFASATGDDFQIVAMTFVGGGDLEVIDSDGLSEDRANPQVSLQSGGRSAIAVCALGSGADVVPTLLSGMTLVFSNDSGSERQHVARQTNASTSDFTIGFTLAIDDVSFVALTLGQALPAANIPAGHASGSGSAATAGADIGAQAGHASGTGEVHQARGAVSVPIAEVAIGSGQVLAAKSSLASTGSLASGSGAAHNATVSAGIVVNAGHASGRVAEGAFDDDLFDIDTFDVGTFNASAVTSEGNINADAAVGVGAASEAAASISASAVQAVGTGQAHGPVGTASIGATAALGTGTAHGATTAEAAAVIAATGTGVSGNAAAKVAATAAAASGTGTAFGAAVSSSPAVSASAGHASGTGIAHGVNGAEDASAIAATGTGQAFTAGASVSATAGHASGTGQAFNATATSASITNANAGHASGTGEAFAATATTESNVTVNAQAASGTGVAHGGGGSVSGSSGAATGTGGANGTLANVAAQPSAATGIGAVYAVTFLVATNVGAATGTGTAYDVSGALTPPLPRGAHVTSVVIAARPRVTIAVPSYSTEVD